MAWLENKIENRDGLVENTIENGVKHGIVEIIKPKIGRSAWFRETVEKIKFKYNNQNWSKFVFENGRFFENSRNLVGAIILYILI